MPCHSILPQDLIFEVLSRLPVKSLLRLKTVCRHWLDLISSSNFIATHLGQSNCTSSLLLTFQGRYREATTYGISLLDDELAMLKHQDLPFQAKKRGDIFSIVGCCNGLVCISLEDDGADCVIWNPATRQYWHMPAPLIPVVPNHCFVRWGFGFHPETNEHKLLRIVQSFDQEKHVFPRRKYMLRTEIFTLSTGLWREINGIPPCICQDRSIAVAVKGVQHRIVNKGWSRSNGGFVLSFDMGTEQFSKIEVPPNCGHNKRQKLLPFRQLLAMLVWTAGFQSIFDMWTMKNDSWTKLFVVGPFPKPVFAIGVWRNCEILVCPAIKEEEDDMTLHNDRLLLFGTLTKVTREVPNSKVQSFHEGGTYAESLLSVYPGF
uniref:F-box domain-containing protein n=1 Tax=Rhizophora mucronata TaxID=61149 RepID=A0A2P2N259_RHIMU